jgi:hypothetical protein
MIPNWIIKKWFDKANSSGTDVMRWSDFLEALDDIKGNNITDYTENNINVSGIPTYADEDAAVTGGLSEGDLYKTSTGAVRVKLEDL